jgi:ribosomal-protein-alanine N-acetyltransferase
MSLTKMHNWLTMGRYEFTIIETERLILREFNPDTYKFVFSHYSDDELMDLFGLVSNEQLISEKARVERGISTYNISFAMFQIIEKHREIIIGRCGYSTWFFEDGRAEIGYVIYNEMMKKKGYMREAMSPIIDYGFKKMNLNRIEAFVGPGNIASLKLMSSFSFVQEGILREHFYKNKLHENAVAFSLLKSDHQKNSES